MERKEAMTFKVTALAAAAALILAACNGDDPQRDAELEDLRTTVAAQQERISELEAELAAEPESPPVEEPSPAPPFSEEGLFQQLHETEPPPELGFEPEPGPWRRARAAEGLEAPTTRDLAFAAVEELGAAPDLGTDAWEIAVRVLKHSEERVTAAVLVWGLPDDAVAGFDIRLALVPSHDGWRVVRAAQRDRCARGVTDDGLCI
jgi:hypothetical protein